MGWLLLDNLQESILELSHVQSQYRNHPDVLEFDWILRARQSDWAACLKSGQTLVEVAPERAAGWIHRAYALRRIEGLHRAWESLLPAAQLFPEEIIIPYNLACYACQLDDLPAAWTWLKRAFETAENSGEKAHWTETALHDPDLEPLWPEIRQS